MEFVTNHSKTARRKRTTTLRQRPPTRYGALRQLTRPFVGELIVSGPTGF